MMILCVNLNAAIDKTMIVSPFRINEIHRPKSVLMLAGGKGINVARSLKCLGEVPFVTGWVGGFAGEFIENRLKTEDIRTEFVKIIGESRTCLSILDPESETLTELYERGEAIQSEEIEEFIMTFKKLLSECSAVTLSGSLPLGVPVDFYGSLLKIANQMGVPAVLDSSGDALREGLRSGRPLFIKPNKKEFEELVGAINLSDKDLIRVICEISQSYHTTVILSLGAEGALAAQGSDVVQAVPPDVKIQSAVGSGDALLAGVTLGLMRKYSLEVSLKMGVAAGTANALTIGAGMFSRIDYDRVYQGVRTISLKN